MTLLHVHTPCSFKREYCEVSEIISNAKEAGYNALSITDLDNMKKVPEFYKSCKEAGIKPIIGLDALMEDGFRIVLIAKNYDGYLNLMKISSFAYLHHMKEDRVFTSYEDLLKNKDGLIILLPMLESKVGNALKKDFKSAEEELYFFRDNFDEVYLEVRRDNEFEKEFSKKIIELANKTDIPLVASSNIFFYERWKRYYEEEEELFNDNLYCDFVKEFKSKEEMETLFEDIIEAVENSDLIAGKINFEISFEYEYPKFKFLKEYAKKENLNPKNDFELLEYLAHKNLEEYLKDIPEKEHIKYKHRLEKELKFFKKSKIASYILTFWDIMRFLNTNVFISYVSGINSLIAYLFGLTKIDPIKWDFVFELILNEHFIINDNFNIFLSEKCKQKALEYLKNNYGIYSIACIEDFVFLKPFTIDNKLLTKTPLYKHHQNEECLIIQYENFKPYLYFNSEKYEPINVIELTLEKLKDKGIKIDLNNINLDDKKVLELISNRFTAGIKGLEITCIDKEESCMNEYIEKFNIQSFEDLLNLLALNRLGPKIAGIVDEFINRKNTFSYFSNEIEEKIFNLLEDILTPTYGLILYQEQILKILNEIGDFDLAEANLVKIKMGKRRPVKEYKERFINNALKKDIDLEIANYLFDLLYQYAGYAIKKSYIVMYALLVYQMSYLKTYYPNEFMHSLIEVSEDIKKKIYYLEEAKKMGILDFRINIEIF